MINWHDVVAQPQTTGFRRVYDFARQNEFTRGPFTDHEWQKAAATGGNTPNLISG